MYGASEHTYKLFTGVAEAFNMLLNSLRNLIHYNVPITISLTVTKIHINEVENMVNTSSKLGVTNFVLARPTPLGRGEKFWSSLELSKEEERKALKNV